METSEIGNESRWRAVADASACSRRMSIRGGIWRKHLGPRASLRQREVHHATCVPDAVEMMRTAAAPPQDSSKSSQPLPLHTFWLPLAAGFYRAPHHRLSLSLSALSLSHRFLAPHLSRLLSRLLALSLARAKYIRWCELVVHPARKKNFSCVSEINTQDIQLFEANSSQAAVAPNRPCVVRSATCGVVLLRPLLQYT